MESIFKEKGTERLIRSIQFGFTHLTAFLDKIALCVDETDFRTAFDTVSHRTLLWKQTECSLDKWTGNQLHYQSKQQLYV